jgi:hypothetical protein
MATSSFTSSVTKALSQIEDQIQSLTDTLAVSGVDVQGLNLQQLVQKVNSELRRLRRQDQIVKDLGYSSIRNLEKGLKMTTPESRRRKTKQYYEETLPAELLSLPLKLRVTSDLREGARIDKFLVESLYPTFEEYLGSAYSDPDKLLDKWAELETSECLLDLKNWCVERMFNVKERLPSDKIRLEDLAVDSCALSSYTNESIRRELATWTAKTGLSVTREEYEAFWEDCSYDRIVKKLLSRYAGFPMSQYAIQALKDEGYIVGEDTWKDGLELERVAVAMAAVGEMEGKAKWDTDFVDAAREAISKYPEEVVRPHLS